MVKIIINNSFSTILGLNLVEEKELRKLLSYSVGNFFSGPFGPRKKSLLSKKCEFPTGLLKRVHIYLSTKSIAYEKLEERGKRVCPNPLWDHDFGVTPYKDQIKAAEKAIICRRGTIVMPTGTGKSLVIALIVAKLNVKTLIVVPSLEIKKQLTDGLKETLKGRCNVTVENIDSAALKNIKGYDCLIIDEAHHVAAKTYQKLNKTAWQGIYWRFFLTATPFRNDTEETLLFESIAGRVIYQLNYEDSVKKGYIVPVESYYIEVPKQETDAYTWSQVYSELVVNNTVRNEIIALTLLRLNQNNVSTLCLVKEVAHGKKLAELTGLPFVSGEDDDSRQFIRQFNSGGQKVIIATEGIMGEGVDSKPCEYVVIAGLGKAKSAFMQKVGRAVRRYTGKESAKVILFRDRSHKFTLRHYNDQRRILKDEYGSIPIKLEVIK